MEIIKSGARPSKQQPSSWFTGTVRYDAALDPHAGSDLSGGHVTFEPGARTHWHTHPKGQVLIVTFGRGLVQREGGKIEEIHAGDIVWFEPNEKHWHGASATTAMSHYAFAESVNGSPVNWLEPVTDKDYQNN